MLITKIDAARIQIDVAIEHFFKAEYVPAITLAGAAEDILAGLLRAQGKQSAFDFLHDWYQKTYATTISAKDFSRNVANTGRNWLKHASDDSDTELEMSGLECVQMLMRALPIYHALTSSHTDNMNTFFKYVENNKDQFDEIFP